MPIADLDKYLDSKLLIVIKDILANPSVMGEKERSFSVADILDISSIDFQIHSQHLFAFMSTAFSPGKKEKETFLENYPVTRSFISSLGKNRQQYAMILFNIIRKFDPLATQIVQHKIREMVEDDRLDDIIDTYTSYNEFRYRKAIYLASPDIIRAKIIMIDSDQRIQELRYED